MQDQYVGWRLEVVTQHIYVSLKYAQNAHTTASI